MRKIIILILYFCFASGLGSAQKVSQSFLWIEGEWLVKFESGDIGLVQTAFSFHIRDSTFIAYTRKGATNEVFGFWKATLARIFTDDFKKGALIHIDKGKIEQKRDTFFLKGIFRSPIGNYYFNGKIVKDSLTAKLTNAKNENRGIVSGKKTVVAYPLEDYPKIVNETLETVKNKIYNRSITESKDWRRFKKRIKNVAIKVKDDIEMVFAFFYFSDRLPISHLGLVKPIPSGKQEKINSELPEAVLVLEEKSEHTAYLQIKSFDGSIEEMDSLFSIIKLRNYQNLIVDLRNNSGGNIGAGMAFAKNVVDTTILAGIFLTQKWFSEHNYIPDKDQYGQFPYFTKASFDLIIEGLHNEKGLTLQIIPNDDTFQGKLFVLTNNQTASTCEPIVYGLKNANRAVVIGETTAGEMLNGEFFTLSSGFSVIVPTADYYTSDGYRIDQNGVKPNIEVVSEYALQYVIENLIRE